MSSPSLPIFRHLVSVTSFGFVAINLLFWLPWLLVAALLRLLLPFAVVRRWAYKAVQWIYRTAVILDAWWFDRVLGIRFELEDPENVLAQLTPEQSPVILCNHQTWFDIFLLQTLISARGPILQFVIKAELIWVPVLGWICLAMNFPRLSRKRDAKSRAADRGRVQSASLTLSEEPGGLLIFPEGTRSTASKREASGSVYTHLMRPKSGGMSVIGDSMPSQTPLLDIGVRYQAGDVDCWRCMSGAVKTIAVRVDGFRLDEIESTADWLNQRWLVKDNWMEQ